MEPPGSVMIPCGYPEADNIKQLMGSVVGGKDDLPTSNLDHELHELLASQKSDVKRLFESLMENLPFVTDEMVTEFEGKVQKYLLLHRLLALMNEVKENEPEKGRLLGQKMTGKAEEKAKTKSDDLCKLLISITGPAAVALVAYALNGSPPSAATGGNSHSKKLMGAVAGANAAGFVSCLASLRLRESSPVASKFLDKLGSAAAATGIILMMSLFLPGELFWVALLAAGFSVVALLI